MQCCGGCDSTDIDEENIKINKYYEICVRGQ